MFGTVPPGGPEGRAVTETRRMGTSPRGRRRAEVPAIAAGDLDELLDQLGVATAHAAGRLLCSQCNGSIPRGGLAAIAFREGEHLFCCSDIVCLERFHVRANEGCS